MPTDDATRFVHYITDLTEDTGARAALRSGLGRTVDQATRMHAYVARWTSSSAPHREAVLYTVAALMALNPEGVCPSRSPGNVGASVALFGAVVKDTRDKSMHLLARQPASQLCRMLTRVLVPLRTDNVPVDFAVLIDDASGWPWRQQQISRRWLQSYYRAVDAPDDRNSANQMVATS